MGIAGRLGRATRAWQESKQSMSGVEAAHLSSPNVVIRVRTPSVVSQPGPWLQYMGRCSFLDALRFVQDLSAGHSGCITGPQGSGKSFLLATLAAFLAHQPGGGAVVYIDGGFFVNTPLDILLLSLCVTFGGSEAALAELVTIETWESAVEWLKQRREVFYFFVDNADAFVKSWRREPSLEVARKAASACLSEVTHGAIVVYAAVAPLCLNLDAPPSIFLLGGFGAREVRSFLKSNGHQVKEVEHLWHCTGGVPLMLEKLISGELNSWLYGYYYDLLDDYFEKLKRQGEREEWRLVFKVIAGGNLGGYDNEVVLRLMGETSGLLARNELGIGTCVCDAIKVHASFLAIERTSLGMEQVLEIWMAPSTPRLPSPWNCLMAVATVLKLGKPVLLDAVGEAILVNSVRIEAPGWLLPYSSEQMLLNPMGWPSVIVAMQGKVFVLSLDEDFDLHHKSRAQFLKSITRVCDECHTYFVWIGFGPRVKKPGVVCRYGDHTDVFINYGMLHSLLAPLDNLLPVAYTRCHYIPQGRKQSCKIYAHKDGILCHLHSIYDLASKQDGEAGKSNSHNVCT